MHLTIASRSASIVPSRVVLAGCCLLVAAAHAETVSLSPVADNTLFFNGTPDTLLSNGEGDGIFVGRTGSRGGSIRQRGLLRFDLSAIPAGSTITNVTLRMNATRVGDGSVASSLRLHRVTAAWGEGASNSFGGAGTASEPGDANWIERISPGTNWSTAGGDFVAVASATANAPSSPGSVSWTSTTQLVADATAWLAAPSSNHGWLIQGNETTNESARKFASREGSASQRPSLTITFTRPVGCDGIDFNDDGLFPDDNDLIDFLTVLAGGTCSNAPNCNDIDFNNDGLFPDDNDLIAFLRVLAGGNC